MCIGFGCLSSPCTEQVVIVKLPGIICPMVMYVACQHPQGSLWNVGTGTFEAKVEKVEYESR